METKKIYAQHEENNVWMNSLLFYQDEIKVMKHRLEELASKTTSKEIYPLIEHFQNQLIVQKNNIDELKHKINLSNDLITKEIKNNGVAVDHRKIADHSDVRTEMDSLTKVFVSLKAELNQFLVKNK